MDSYTDDVRMTPEGDVARFGEDVETIVQRLRDFADDGSICMHDASDAADLLESQATRIAELTGALELIAEASYLDGACLIARRALSAGQGEVK